MKTIDRMIAVGEASRVMGVSPVHVRRLIHSGRLPAIRTTLGFLVEVDDVERLKRERLK